MSMYIKKYFRKREIPQRDNYEKIEIFVCFVMFGFIFYRV